MDFQHIMNLAIRRRDELIKQRHKLEGSDNMIKYDQITMMLESENVIVADCEQMLEEAESKLFFERFPPQI
jgi:hypothetical protein